jgi:hypothetical protein
MSDRSRLERRYRRLLACYPRVFRREHEEEMLMVLLACAGDGRQRPGVADSVNLLWHGLWLRLRPVTKRSVPTVFWGVRLIVLAAALELVALVTVLASEGTVHSAVLRQFAPFTAAHWAAVVHGQILPVEIGAPIAAVGWLVLAWANDHGHRWARAGVVSVSLLTVLSLLVAIGRHAATYASADLIAGIGLCVVALAAMLLIISTDSNGHYDQSRPGGDASRLDPDRPAPAPIWRGGPNARNWT